MRLWDCVTVNVHVLVGVFVLRLMSQLLPIKRTMERLKLKVRWGVRWRCSWLLFLSPVVPSGSCLVLFYIKVFLLRHILWAEEAWLFNGETTGLQPTNIFLIYYYLVYYVLSNSKRIQQGVPKAHCNLLFCQTIIFETQAYTVYCHSKLKPFSDLQLWIYLYNIQRCCMYVRKCPN